MANDQSLKPEDFPVHTQQKQIVKGNGKTIADTPNPKIAEDIAEFGKVANNITDTALRR
jgi:hypothetical protein